MFKKDYKITTDGFFYFIIYKYKAFPLNLLGWLEFDLYDSELYDTYQEAKEALVVYINSEIDYNTL
jgi:hypothetical protein